MISTRHGQVREAQCPEAHAVDTNNPVLTENELQRQIILLQQTVIGVLEDALYSGRPLNRAGLEKLVWASEAARAGSLDALRGQYQRITQELPPAPPPGRAEIAEVYEVTSSRSASSPRRPGRAALLPPPPPEARSPARLLALPAPAPPSPSSSSSSLARSRRAPPPPRARSGALDFLCRYAADLQHSPSMPLAGSFDPGQRGGSRCPGCRARVPVDAEDMWDIEFPVRSRRSPPLALLPPAAGAARGATARDPSPPGRSPSRGPGGGGRFADDRDRGRSRTGKEVVAVLAEEKQQRKGKMLMMRFRVPARFVVKCHTPEGDYACVLCCGPRGDYAGPVVLCDDPETLIHHVAKEHRVSEIEDEVDILPG